MKILLTALIGLLLTVSVYGNCGGYGFNVFPIGQNIKQNSIFVIDGFSLSQNIIKELNKKYNVYLKAGDKEVKLIVKETWIGQYELTQAILSPETKLEAGLEYTMYIDSLPEHQILHRYNKETKQYDLIKYKVVAGEDMTKPLVLSKPKEIDKLFTYYGCGPFSYVIFDLQVRDSSEVIVKTIVKDLTTGKETTYYILPTDQKLYVGHECGSGAFYFGENLNYEVEFSFMDASGNIASWTGEGIKFTKPTSPTW